MAQCGRCRHRFRTLDDEEGMHDCPRCGWDGQQCDYCGCWHRTDECPDERDAETDEPDNSDEVDE